MFDNVLVGILVLAATFTVGLFIGWRVWANVAKEASADKRDLEQDVANERRKGTAILQQRDDAKTELELHKKRIVDLEAELAKGGGAQTLFSDDANDQARAAAADKAPADAADRAQAEAADTARLEAAEKARSEAEARAQLAEARAVEAEKRLAETDVKARGADTLIKKMESRSPEIDEAKARREAEAKHRAEADAKAKAEAEAKHRAEADAKAKTEADAKSKAEADAKSKAEADAKSKAEADAKSKAEADARAKADADAKSKADADAKAKAKADADAKPKADAPPKAEADSKAKAPSVAAGPAKPAGVSDAFWAMFGPKVPVADPSKADEIVGGIKGIGPVTGKRLNELGIFTYAQIAAFDADIINKVAAAVGAIPAKVVKEDWPGQAKKKLGGAA